MATTTNYGWTTPDDTALVKDGASAIRTLGSSIDTTTKNLNPETTLGDIAYRSSSSNTNTRLAIGATGNVLTVAGGVPTWAAPAGGATFVGCSITKSVSQSISNNTGTFLSFDTEDFDTDGFHDNSTNNSRITIPSGKAGKYQVNFNLQWAANATGTRYCMLAKNGTTVVEKLLSVSTTGGYAEQFIGIILNLSVADYIEAKVDQSSGGSLDVWGNNSLNRGTSLSVSYLGA